MRYLETWCGLSGEEYQLEVYAVGENLPHASGVYIICGGHEGHWEPLEILASNNLSIEPITKAQATYVHVYVCSDKLEQNTLLRDLLEDDLMNDDMLPTTLKLIVNDEYEDTNHQAPSVQSNTYDESNTTIHAFDCSAA